MNMMDRIDERNGVTFENWLLAVDKQVSIIVGLGIDDLPDWHSWDTWDSGASPREGAVECIEYCCDDMGFDADEIMEGFSY